MKLLNEIKEHLEKDGRIQITTYLKSTIYSKKHADMFFSKNDNLHVKRGKQSDQLSIKDQILVSIRFGK